MKQEASGVVSNRTAKARSLLLILALCGINCYQIATVQIAGAQPPAGGKSCTHQLPEEEETSGDDGSESSDQVALEDWQSAFLEIELDDESSFEGEDFPPSPPPRRDEVLAQQLNLSREQAAQLEKICEVERAQMKALHDKTQSAIAAILTDEQRAQFEKLPPPHPPHPPRGNRPPPSEDETEE